MTLNRLNAGLALLSTLSLILGLLSGGRKWMRFHLPLWLFDTTKVTFGGLSQRKKGYLQWLIDGAVRFI